MALIFIPIAIILVAIEVWNLGVTERKHVNNNKKRYYENRAQGIFESSLYTNHRGITYDIFTLEEWKEKTEWLPGNRIKTYYENKKGERRYIPQELLDFEYELEKNKYNEFHTVYKPRYINGYQGAGEITDLLTRKRVKEERVRIICRNDLNTKYLDLDGKELEEYNDMFYTDINIYILEDLQVYVDYETNEILRFTDNFKEFYTNKIDLESLFNRIKYFEEKGLIKKEWW